MFTLHKPATARTRLLTSVIMGLVVFIVCTVFGAAKFAILAAWDGLVLCYAGWLWWSVWPMSAEVTRTHAIKEDPGRAIADGLLLLASVGSLAAVAILTIDAAKNTGLTKAFDIILGLGSVVLSWAMVHTVFMLKYARLYYGHLKSSVDFNENDPPCYVDFAYLAFTLGMTFQVSDTNLKTKEIRATALKHALLSYLFGTVIIVTTVNTLANLS
jgi:uncharacterized membrane protein